MAFTSGFNDTNEMKRSSRRHKKDYGILSNNDVNSKQHKKQHKSKKKYKEILKSKDH
jgi:hypothetical protein